MEYSSDIEAESRNVLAIARWEDNREEWLEGNFFGLASKENYLQELVGEGGTLWIVVSRSRPGGKRLYSIMFKLSGCRLRTYKENGKFGKYAVLGDTNQSVLYASNNSELLLMSLRFHPTNPIDDISKIGQSIQRPRLLSKRDVDLLDSQMLSINRWSVFLSYKRDDSFKADRLYNHLSRLGVNLFQDHVSIKAGSNWETVLLNAVRRSRCVVVLIGKKTHESEWVKKEVNEAISMGVSVVPILIGGSLDNWVELSQVQAIKGLGKNISELANEVFASLPIP